MIFNLYILKEKLNLTFDLKEIINLKLSEKYGENVTQEIKKRIELELQYIIDNHSLNIFKIAYLISKDSIKSNNFMRFKGWGSSFIAYLLDISFVNPLEFNIPVESFTNSSFLDSSILIEASYDYLWSDNNICKIMEENEIEYKIIHSQSELKPFEHNKDYYCLEFYNTQTINKLTQYKNLTRVDFKNININDTKIYDYINQIDVNIFETSKTLKLFKKIKPYNLDTLLKFSGVQNSEIDYYLKLLDEHDLKDIPATREDIFDYLVTKGIDRQMATDVALKFMFIEKKKNIDIWEKYKKVLLENGITDSYIKLIEDHKVFLFPKSYLIEKAILNLWIIWFKINYKELDEQIEKQKLILNM